MTGHVPRSEPAPGVRLPGLVRVAAGAATVLTVEVTNTADQPRRLAVLAIGVDQAWLPGPAQTPVLAPGESATVDLRLAPSAGTLPAQYPVAVTVQALLPDTGRAAGSPSGIGESTLVVNPRARLRLEVTPERSRLVRRQRIQVLLANGGAAETTAELETSGTKGLEVRLRRRSVTLPAGGEVRLRGRLVVTRPRLFGRGAQHSWTVTATGPDVVRRVRGVAEQTPVLGPAWGRAAALLSVVAVWIAAAVVFIPQLADRFGGEDDDVVTVTGTGEEGEEGAGEDGAGGADGAGADGGPGSDVKVTRAESPATPKGLQLNGTVTADDPGGVTVTLEPTSLVDEEADGAEGQEELLALASYGKTPQAALLPRIPGKVARTRSATTTVDGTWSFPDVTAPGYYLVTFSKPGYDPQRYVVDSSTVDATEPLEVELEPGDGTLSGRVTSGAGPVPAATVTISDGTSTLTTSSASRGEVGRWSVSGLATPGSYLVQVTSFGHGTESRLVDLDAGGEATADVRLEPGVAALVGKVEGLVPGGQYGGLGGVTVSVTDEAGERRTATTVTTKALAGRYHLSGLPSPGVYTVTLSAEGYQTQTSRVELRDGQSIERLNAELVSSTGVVTGRVLEKPGRSPVVGAGLTLSNGTDSYKTTSVDSSRATDQPAGAFRFNGVRPGTYQLTTEYFEFDTEVLTVEVRAGRLAEAYPRIRKTPGGVLPAASVIRGNAVDKYSGDPIECARADPCRAYVVDHTGETVEAEFVEDEEYILPDPGGLEPGLYAVTVTAPGYESATVRVQVPLDSVVVAPTAELTKLPVINGTLRVSSGVPTPESPDDPVRTCVWAVPNGATQPSTDCRTAIGNRSCRASTAPRGELTPGTVCEWVEGLDRYNLEVPAAGSYTLIARMTDTAYDEIAGIPVNIAPGGTAVQNLEFIRLAEIQVITQELDDTGSPRAFEGATVSVARIRADGTTEPVDDEYGYGADGRVHVVGLRPGGYRVTASASGKRTDTGDVYVLVDQVQTTYLTLGDVPQPFVAQVVTDGGRPVDGAQVQVTAPVGFDGATPQLSARTASTRVTPTDDDGCVAFHNTGDPPGTMSPCDGGFEPGAASVADFASGWATRIRVSAPGYEELILTDRQLVSVMTLHLDPEPVRFTSSLSSQGAAPASYQATTFTVSSTTTPTGTVTVTADAGGTITWNDTRYPSGNVRPGTYTLTAQLPGYVSEPVTFTCSAGTTCAPPGPVLRQLGSLTVQAVDQAGHEVRVDDVIVTLRRGGSVVATRTSPTDGNAVTFPNLVPGATDYSLRIQGAGYRFGQGTLSCTDPTAPLPDAPRVGEIRVGAGVETTCTADLDRLARITGAVQGVLAAPPGSSPVRALAGARVTATRCTAVHPTGGTPQYCTAVGGTRFTATTGPDGSFVVTGTNQAEGITDGTWLLTAAQSGWTRALPAGAPSTALRGVVVEVTGGSDVDRTVQLHVDPVTFDVHLRNQFGQPLPGATVELLRSTTSVATATPVSGEAGTYRFAGAIPGNYTVQVTGSGVVRSTALVDVVVGVAEQGYVMTVTRAANSLSGTVAGSDAPSGLADVQVTLHACPTGGGACASEVADGTDGTALTRQTSAAGTFEFRNIPDGVYEVRFRKRRYESARGGPFSFDHTLASVPPLSVTLAQLARNVRVDLTTLPAGGDLTGATVALVPSSSDTGGNTAQAAQTVSAGSTTFNQVPYGCWELDVTLPTGHHGRVELPADTEHPDAGCRGDVVVPTGPGNATITAAVRVVESRVELQVTGDPVTGHAAPSNARVEVGGVPLGSDEVVVGGGGLVLHLAPGSYVVTATALGLSAEDARFWPAATKNLEVTRGDAPSVLTVPLAERLGALTVRTVLEGTTTTVAGTVTLTPGTGQGAAVPTAYATGVATTGSVVLDLPSGAWDVTATTADGRTVTVDDVELDALTRTVTVELPPPPGPGG